MQLDAKFRLLVVDDEKTNLDVLTHMLKPLYTVYVAKSGEEGLRRARRNVPDLILLDIVMPDMSGFDVLVALKNADETRDIPVIFITGLTNSESEAKGLSLGAVDYITKPFNMAIVKARVETHLKIVRQMRTIEQLGLIDPLTGVPNRRSFDNHSGIEWSRAFREKEPIGLIMLDVDNFKQYNDTYGHPQGDQLLQALAKTLQSALRRPADLLARVGGEEFVALLPNTDAGGAKHTAEHMRAEAEAMRVALASGSYPPPSTISLGVSCVVPTRAITLKAFVEITDRALYMAKAGGRNTVVYKEPFT